VIAKNGSSYFLTGHTHGGNPLCAAGALAVLKYIEKNDVINSVKEKGKYIEKKLKDLYTEFSIVNHYRGKGLMWGVEIAQNKVTNEPFPNEFGMTKKLVNICFDNGLLVYPSQGYIDGVLGDSILLSPSFLISYEEIDKMFDILGSSIKQLEALIK
jgi:adenosylmethionine-8-amino-7-oxononanoate aminotransferase